MVEDKEPDTLFAKSSESDKSDESDESEKLEVHES